MSGSSLNWLSRASAEDLLGGEPHTDEMRQVVDMMETRDLPGAVDLAARTLRVMAFVRHAREELEQHLAEVREAWEAVERYESGDDTEDQLAEALAKVKPVEVEEPAHSSNSARRIATIGMRLHRSAKYPLEEAHEIACSCVSSVSPAARKTALNLMRAQSRPQ